MSAGDLLSIVIIGVGIYSMAEGLPVIGRWIYSTWAKSKTGNVSDGALAAAVVRCLLGFWLILGSRGIAKLISKYGGRWRDAGN
jgi:hypothetical protein